MIERIEISSEALPFNGVDTGFRNTHDRDFQKACMVAIEDVLRKVFEIHEETTGRISARIEYIDDGYAGRIVEVPWGISAAEKIVWKTIGGRLLDEDVFEEMKLGGHLYAGVAIVFQGCDLMRIGFLLSCLAEGASGEGGFKSLVSTFGIMASRAVRLEELRYLSRHDALTGLANRTLFLQKIAGAIAEIPRDGDRTVLFEIRLASLGEVNDNLGYHAGDELILEAARRLSDLNGGKGFVARVGGSKFMVLLRHGGGGDFGRLMRMVENAMEAPIRVDGQEIRMNVDIGCVSLDDPKLHPVEAIQRAETAVTDARSRSVLLRPKAYIYSEDFFQTNKRKIRLNGMVRQAYRENRFFLHFQPVVDLRKSRIVGCEALLRMRDEQDRIVEAGAFMPAVARVRYQSTLDRWVFTEILRLHKESVEMPGRLRGGGFSIAMNCDPGLLAHKGLAREWLEGLGQASFDPRWLVLEVVENPFLFENPVVAQNLRTFRREGVRIAIDDFGSGYSNLRHLSSLPVDIVKFDRGFLQGFGGGESREALVLRAMLDLCGELDYETTCEGVETQAHADFLGGIDCRCAQGFFYGKPMPLQEVLVLADRYDTTADALESCHASPESPAIPEVGM